MNTTTVYKCPCCGAPLAYSGESGKLVCGACSNSYDIEQIESLNGGSESAITFEQNAGHYTRRDAQAMTAYVCENCGAELMTDATTTATECPYCGSPTILPGQLESGVKPKMIIPFKITKEEAEQTFLQYFKGKRLMPNIFLKTRNRIAEMKKLYVPYWLFDCAADASITYTGEKVRVRRQGDWEIRTVDHYMLSRAGSMTFSAIPVDGSVRMDDRISESLEPYDLSEAVPFQSAMLAGALADHADVGAEECEVRAVERVERSVEETFRQTTAGYSSVTVKSRQIHSRDGKVTPVLMPVWMITTEKEEKGEKKTYTFAINGQTGELTCDVPADMGKGAAWFAGVFAGVCAAGYALLVAMNAMGVFA